MSNQDNTGLSIFDDDEPEAGSKSAGARPGRLPQPTARRRR